MQTFFQCLCPYFLKKLPLLVSSLIVTHVKKKGSKQDFAGIRPIIITRVFSKLYESFLADWLKVKIIPNVDQIQFENLHSTSTTYYLVHTIWNKLEEPNTWLNVIAVDLQKAFDLINHDILVKKTSQWLSSWPLFNKNNFVLPF